jgi:adenylate cyclase
VRRLVVDQEDLDMVFEEQNTSRPGDERQVVVMFSDIRDFTTFAHTQLPHDVVHILNRYFKKSGDPILANGGFIDKYLGDGVLAVSAWRAARRLSFASVPCAQVWA